MEFLLQFLQSIHPLSEPLLGHLALTIKEREVKKGQFILRAGHISPSYP
jgi:hypothetical protein